MGAPNARIAAIVCADRRAADKLVGEFATNLIRAGRDVHGLIQWRGPEGAVLADLQGGTHYPLFQNLGAGSQSCSVDSGSLAIASQALRRALTEQADLAIANRFGPLETTGGGLAAEMLALMAADIPFLTIVAEEHRQAWRNFTGDAGIELAAKRVALDEWFIRLDKESA